MSEALERDARLMAAAPELLAALQALLIQKPYKDGDGTALYHAENMARTAIAKAEGERLTIDCSALNSGGDE